MRAESPSAAGAYPATAAYPLGRAAPRGPIADALHRLRRNRGAVVALAVLAVLVVAALLAPWITPYDPIEPAPPAALQAPGGAHPMGTDALGRDIFTRLVYGTRISLLEGVI